MSDSPVAVLHNVSGTEVGTAGNPLRTEPAGSTAQPITAASLPLPSGASTSAKQPALGTAGTPSADVISVQGVSGGTPQPVSDGGGSLTVDGPLTDTQLRATAVPVNGSVTANIGTSGSLALDATLTGGTQKAIARGGAKGATAAADVTSTAEGTDHQALDVQIMSGGVAKDPTQVRALTSADVVTAAQGTAAAVAGAWPVKVTDGTNSMPTMDTAGRAGFEKVTDGTNTAAVKAASTAAVAGDTALVVAVSPNNTPVLPSGAATSSAQTTGNNSLSSIDTKTPALGQAAMAASSPVVIANNQTAVPVSGPLTDTQLRATVVPVGDGGGSLTVDGPLTDTQLRATAVPVSAAALPLPSGASTSANQTTLGNQTTKINDGTNTAAVKPASTAAVAGDPALVVAISPNNALSLAGNKTNNNAAPGADNIGALPAVANAANPSWTEGRLVALSATLSGALRVVQHAAGALANWWAVRITDGTNAMPTMDVAARAGFVQQTDGTNVMPTGDAAARGIYERITDGTSTAAVKAASTGAVATDPALVVALTPNKRTLAASHANVAAAAASTLLLAANAARCGMTLWNDSTATLYIKWGSGASPTSCVVAVPRNGYYELPVFGNDNCYRGDIYGYWTAATGSARVTELA
jgi:hypothetical protein